MKTRIVILIIISLLSNYFLILGEFTGVVLAATEEWNARPSIILPENNEINSTDGQSTESNGEINTEQTENESKTDESKPDQSETDESKPDQSETNESETDQLNTNQVETNETEEETETDNVSDENSESEKSSEEKLEASIGIINTYKFLNGLIVKAKISMETKNVKSNLDSEKIVFSTPQIDGFKLINTYLEDVKLNDETLTYTSSIVNNEVVVDIVTAYVDESSNEITGEANETESNEVVSNINTGLVSGIDNNNETTQEEITIKDTEKEYTILYVFEGEGEAQKINLNVGQSLNYNDNIKELNSALEAKIEIQEKLNNKYSVSAQNSSIYKGYLYANSLTSLNYETRYTSIEEIEIVDLNNLDNIIITEKADNIVLKNGAIKDISNYTSYSKTSVDVKLFDNIFGEEGYIEIYSNGRLLGRIDKNSKVKDDRYVFEYPEIVSNVEFSLNNMINKGKIDILSNKAIRGTAGFSREEVISFGKIETNTIVQEFSKESEIALKLLETNNKLEINSIRCRKPIQ